MSERMEQDINIKDLPAAETLSAEEKEQLAGAGRFRPTFEALETRQMMDGAMVGTMGTVLLPSGVAAGHVQTLEAPTTKVEIRADVFQGGATGANNQQTDGGADPQSGPIQIPAVAPPATKVETSAVHRSSDQDDIRQKLDEIKQVVTILEAMDDPNLPYDRWLDGQSKKNQQLIATDKTELNLKQSEIEHLTSQLESQPEKATILADDEAELAIMKHKMAKMNDLQTAIEEAQQRKPGADRRVAELTLEISHLELRLKQQQVATLKDQLKISPSEKQAALQKLLEGEQYEVGQLKQIHELNEKIVHHVRRDGAPHHFRKGGDGDTLADLRCRVVHHELLMKQQNMRQLEARLTPTDSVAVQTPATAPANTAAMQGSATALQP